MIMRFVFLFIVLCLAWIPYGVSLAEVKLIRSVQMPVDNRYDYAVDSAMNRVLIKYNDSIKRIINRIIGNSNQYMEAKAPESLLSNFLTDLIFRDARLSVQGGVDFALINLGGIRSSLPKGDVTVGDLYRIVPFENKLVVITLTGMQVEKLCHRIANSGGEGVSNICFIVEKGKACEIRIGGIPLKRDNVYRLATLDYLAEGNVGMSILMQAGNCLATEINVRDVLIRQIELLTKQNRPLESALDGRIQIRTR
jgi:2',3'-cyclic-nucleotide 2'-phosphodiesterase (5'-nucleotidase family)